MIFGLRTADPRMAEEWRRATSAWLISSADGPDKVECECLDLRGLTLLWTTPRSGCPSVTVARDASQVLVLYGWLQPDAAGRPRPAELQSAYQDRGIGALCGLNDRYQAIVFDEESGRLEFANDMLGLLPFYYSSGKDFFAFGDRYYPFRFIPGFIRQLDFEAAASLLQLGYVIGDRTLYTEARRMPPGTTASCQSDYRLSLATSAPLRFTQEHWETPLPDVARHISEILTESLRRGVDPKRPSVIPLSGGFDSRVLALLAARLGLECKAVSFGSKDTRDAILARRVARELGFEHAIVPLPADGVAHYLPRNLRVSEGLVVSSWFWFGLVDMVGAFSPSTISGQIGFGGAAYYHIDTSCGIGLSTRAVFQHNFDFNVKKEKGFTTAELKASLTPEAFSRCGTSTEAESWRVFLSHGEHDFQRLIYWDLMLRQRLYICGDLAIEESAGPVVCPYADTNLLRFVASISENAIRTRRAQGEILRLLSPPLARITLAPPRRPLLPSYREWLWMKRGEPEKLVGWQAARVARKLRVARREESWWDVAYAPSPGMDAMLTESVQRLEGLFQPQFLADIPTLHPYRRRKLALLAKWFEYYM